MINDYVPILLYKSSALEDVMPEFNYSYMFNQALLRIKEVRDPHAQKPETIDLKWNVAESNALFRFNDAEYDKHSAVLNAAGRISVSCMNEIIKLLLQQYGYAYQPIEINEKNQLTATIRLSLLLNDRKELLLFKEIEECPFWKMKDSESPEISKTMSEHGAEKCIYVYYMLDYAYVQVIGHNNDESDPGRGYNIYSLKWFFKEYFGEEECSRFLSALDKYNSDVKNYLGYILVKSLTPNTLLNFRRVTEDRIIRFPFSQILDKEIVKNRKGRQEKYTLDTSSFSKLSNQFLDERMYSVLLGPHDFAESIITAEWLHDSMQKAKAIDLTTVGMGYFKAVEQLLWELICLHKGDGRMMKKNNSFKDLPFDLPLNDDNINEDKLDTTLGSMAVFYSKNIDILRSDISKEARWFIRESLFDYSDLRNGYFHKHNIHKWEKIEEIRNESFYIIFLLLGGQLLSESDRGSIGFVAETKENDFYKLCEYFNYHSGEVFVIKAQQDKEAVFIACADYLASVAPDGRMNYSGLYVRELGQNGQGYKITEESLPKEIALGKMIFPKTQGIHFNFVKVKKVFENGRFVGPSIAEEDALDY